MADYSIVVPQRDAYRHAPAKLDWLSTGVLIADRLGTLETTHSLDLNQRTPVDDDQRMARTAR
jgi:hypothetical protein